MTLIELKEDIYFSFRHPRVRVGVAGLALFGVLALVVGMTYWWPSIHTVNQLKSELDARRHEIARAEYTAKLQQVSSSAVLKIKQIEKKLDTPVTQATVLQNMEGLARQSHVKILSSSYEEGKVKDGYSPLVSELTVQAGYSSLRLFIEGIQDLPTFTVVQEAVLNRSPSSSDIKAQLTVVTYRHTGGHDND